MLKELRIKNLAIIDDLVVHFEEGLNVITGETGAGKSIIVDALGLALGARAQAELIRSDEKQAIVQAYFEIRNPEDYPTFSALGIDMSEGLLLRRTLSSAGKSKAFINDVMVTLQTLSEVGKLLVDIHSQHEHQSLLSAKKQMLLLDSYGKLERERREMEQLFEEVERLGTEYSKLRERTQERAQRLDLLRFQINEIDEAGLVAGEKTSLEQEKKILSNITRLNGLADAAYSALHESDASTAEGLSRALANLREMCTIDKKMAEILESVASAKALIDDASFSLRDYREKQEFDPGRLETVENRLDLIRRLERKYGDGIETVLGYRISAEGELKDLESADDRLSDLEERLKVRRRELLSAAERLSGKRKMAAGEIEKSVTAILKELAFASAEFSINLSREAGPDGLARISSTGLDRIEFLFSANAGEPLKPLAKIVSGGELSRVMLGLKNVLADADDVPVLIFDEVDAGIGGATAEKVGRKLNAVSRTHQLICITHLPQIASLGDFHLKIEKKEENKRMHVDIKELYGKERREEIARMLSGKITEISAKHAGELLGRAD